MIKIRKRCAEMFESLRLLVTICNIASNLKAMKKDKKNKKGGERK